MISQTIGYSAALTILGLYNSILGPTLPWLAERTGVALSQVSLLFTARSFGYLLGALWGGRLYDRVKGHPLMVIILVILAALYGLIPAAPLLALLVGVIFIVGASEGVLDVGANTLVVWVHGSKVGPYMNAMHFFFGVGAFVGPLIVAQALAQGGGAAAYWIVAVCALPVAAWLFRLKSPAQAPESPNAPAKSSSLLLLGLIVLFDLFYVGAEAGFGGWIYTYSLTQGVASVTSAAYLNSLYWGAFTLGRLISIPLAFRLRAHQILIADLFFSLASLAVMLLWPHSWIAAIAGTAGLGLALASVFPTMLIWAEKRIHLTGKTTAWFFIGGSAGGMFFPWLIGQFFDSAGPLVAIWIILLAVVASILVFGLLNVYSRSLKRQSSAE